LIFDSQIAPARNPATQDPALIPVRFFFVRHGETEWNREQRTQGQVDVRLNDTGRRQAHAARTMVAALGARTVCASPLVRARETAEILNEGLGLPMHIVDDLKECCWGVRQGGQNNDWFDGWVGGARVEGAEAYDSFLRRAMNGVNAALALPGPVLIVAHGGIFWSIQRYALDVPRRDLDNCAPVRLDPPRPGIAGWTSASPVYPPDPSSASQD
jgi:broad specificity phosphatase PhoE